MAAPGYYITSPGSLIVFPRPPRWDSDSSLAGVADPIEESDIVMETIRLKRYVYKLGKRSTPSFIFRVPEEELEEFQAFHDDVQGQLTPFYYVFNTAASPLATLYCRKEPDFKPTKIGPYRFNGVLQGWFDYTLQLSQERTDVEIET